MVTIKCLSEVDYAKYDEVWVIMRSFRYGNPNIRQVQELSPSWFLFGQYRKLKEQGKWNEDTFRDIYVPQFLKEMHGKAQQELLNFLFFTKKHICLACVCLDETLCHRSVIGGMLQGAGIPVEGLSDDYSYYYNWWRGGVPDRNKDKIERFDTGCLKKDGKKTMCFTGRRPKDLCGYDLSMYAQFMKDLSDLVYQKFYKDLCVRRFLTGGAQGFDQIAFWSVEYMKKKSGCEDVENIVCIPFKEQESRWAAEGLFSQSEYRSILGRADRVIEISRINTIDAFFMRNHMMCENSDLCLGLYPDGTWETSKGGTAECLRYAVEHTPAVYRLGYSLDKSGVNIGQLADISRHR